MTGLHNYTGAGCHNTINSNNGKVNSPYGESPVTQEWASPERAALGPLPAGPPMLFGIIRQLYCIIRWGVTGVNYCAEARARSLEMAGKGIKKLFMSSASSAIGTGNVLGLHGAMAPDEATFQASDLSEATVDESRNMLKVDMDGSTSYFAIALLVLLCLVAMVATTMCCGCSPSKMAKRRQEEERKEEI